MISHFLLLVHSPLSLELETLISKPSKLKFTYLSYCDSVIQKMEEIFWLHPLKDMVELAKKSYFRLIDFRLILLILLEKLDDVKVFSVHFTPPPSPTSGSILQWPLVLLHHGLILHYFPLPVCHAFNKE